MNTALFVNATIGFSENLFPVVKVDTSVVIYMYKASSAQHWWSVVVRVIYRRGDLI